MDYMDKGFDSVRGLVEAFNAAWEAVWSPGYRIIVDESMILWVDGSVHLTVKGTDLRGSIGNQLQH